MSVNLVDKLLIGVISIIVFIFLFMCINYHFVLDSIARVKFFPANVKLTNLYGNKYHVIDYDLYLRGLEGDDVSALIKVDNDDYYHYVYYHPSYIGKGYDNLRFMYDYHHNFDIDDSIFKFDKYNYVAYSYVGNNNKTILKLVLLVDLKENNISKDLVNSIRLLFEKYNFEDVNVLVYYVNGFDYYYKDNYNLFLTTQLSERDTSDLYYKYGKKLNIIYGVSSFDFNKDSYSN